MLTDEYTTAFENLVTQLEECIADPYFKHISYLLVMKNVKPLLDTTRAVIDKYKQQQTERPIKDEFDL